MATHRAFLPISEAKCIANATRCNRTDHCARARVEYVQGRPLTDYSAGYYWDAERCTGFLPIDFHGQQAAKKPHEPVKGL